MQSFLMKLHNEEPDTVAAPFERFQAASKIAIRIGQRHHNTTREWWCCSTIEAVAYYGREELYHIEGPLGLQQDI